MFLFKRKTHLSANEFQCQGNKTIALLMSFIQNVFGEVITFLGKNSFVRLQAKTNIHYFSINLFIVEDVVFIILLKGLQLLIQWNCPKHAILELLIFRST